MNTYASTFYLLSEDVTVRPILVTQYQAVSNTRHLVHEVLGSAQPDITLQQAGPRTGTMAALFEREAEAHTFFSMLQRAEPLDFSDTSVPSVAMPFIANGQITIQQDDQNRRYWSVSFGFMEVPQ